MADDLQIPGGSAETEDQYVGPVRSLRADTSNWELRLHDGVTPGGFRILNSDELDEIFQVKNPELNGFTFSPAAKGFMIRLGPGQYTLRTLEVNTDQLTLTNPQGLADNPKIALADTIASPHTWAETQTFESQIQAPAGVHGDLTGNVAGDLDGNVTGNVAGDTTGSHTGNVDARGHLLQVDDASIDYAKIDPSSIPSPPTPIPSGCILLWSGAANAIPAGWLLCDGTNATPDLRGQFVVGAGGDLTVGESGGTTDHNHTINIVASGVHNHTISIDNTILTTAQIPAHHHSSGICDTTDDVFNRGHVAAVPTSVRNIGTSSGASTHEAVSSDTGGGTGHNHTADIDDSATHTHAVSSDNADHLPPYYALCYIMKA